MERPSPQHIFLTTSDFLLYLLRVDLLLYIVLLATKRASILSRVVNSYTLPCFYTLTCSLSTAEQLIEWDAVVVVINALSVVKV